MLVQPVARQAVRADEGAAWPQRAQRAGEDGVLHGAGRNVVQHSEHGDGVEGLVGVGERGRVSRDGLDVGPGEPLAELHGGGRVELEGH